MGGYRPGPCLLRLVAAFAVPVLYAAFHLRPAPCGRIRLVIRKRGRGPRAATWAVSLMWDPLHCIMQTRQSRNLRTRVSAQV